MVTSLVSIQSAMQMHFANISKAASLFLGVLTFLDSAQGFLLTLSSGIYLVELRGSYDMAGIEPDLAMCKTWVP